MTLQPCLFPGLRELILSGVDLEAGPPGEMNNHGTTTRSGEGQGSEGRVGNEDPPYLVLMKSLQIRAQCIGPLEILDIRYSTLDESHRDAFLGLVRNLKWDPEADDGDGDA